MDCNNITHGLLNPRAGELSQLTLLRATRPGQPAWGTRLPNGFGLVRTGCGVTK